jgi:CRISPR-associated protein Cmr4
MNTRLLLLQARSPIHCGTGQAISGIDLPIAREKATGIPLVPGSSLKGVLRARGADTDATHRAAFGPPTENAADHAGSVQFGDAGLVFLPMRSVCGTFAWVTSHYLLRRLARDVAEAGLAPLTIPAEPANETAARVTTGSRLLAGQQVVFEDLDFQASVDPALTTLAGTVAKWLYGNGDAAKSDREFFCARVCAVHDDVMSLLMQSSMEITARNSLDPNTKTVKKGALWTEEALPTESVLSGLIAATPVTPKSGAAPAVKALFEHVTGLLQGGSIQVGGNATVGRGLCRLQIVGS